MVRDPYCCGIDAFGNARCRRDVGAGRISVTCWVLIPTCPASSIEHSV